MEEDKKKRKNKKKKNRQTKGIENNAVGAEESASSNQNHPAAIRGSEAHTDDTSGIDDDPNRHDTDGVKVASFEEKITQSQKEISSLRRQEANQEEKIRQLHMEKDVYLQKKAEFEMKNSQLQTKKNSWLQKEAGLEKINNELVDEVEKLNSKRVSLEEKVKEMEKEAENRVQKEVGLEERISILVGEVENLNSMRVSLEEKVKETEKERENWVQKEVSLEEKVKEMEKERESWVQKEKSFREIISRLSGDNALLEAEVKEYEELKTNIVQENQLLKANIQALQTQVNNLENSAGPPYSPTGRKMNTFENGDLNSEVVATRALVDKLIGENAELVEKVKNLYVELERRGPPIEVSSFLGSDIISLSSEPARIANESAVGSHMMPGAVHEHAVNHATEPHFEPSEEVLQSGGRLGSLKDTIDKAASDHEYVSKRDGQIVVNSSEIESDETSQIPLYENEVRSADLEVANLDQVVEQVPLTSAPLIGAPFRLISFVARYVSGADLVNNYSAISNR